MDPEITALAQGAAVALVTSMATDAWQAAREGMIRLWRRLQPQQAGMVAAELEAGQAEATAALADDDQELLEELRAAWQGRFRRLLAATPDAAAQVRDLLRELTPEAPGAVRAVTQHATASGRARIYQAGGDQHITENLTDRVSDHVTDRVTENPAER